MTYTCFNLFLTSIEILTALLSFIVLIKISQEDEAKEEEEKVEKEEEKLDSLWLM